MLFMQICSAVDCIHDAKAAHLNLYPETIIVDSFGFIKLGNIGTPLRVNYAVENPEELSAEAK